MRISDWSSDVCSSDLDPFGGIAGVSGPAGLGYEPPRERAGDDAGRCRLGRGPRGGIVVERVEQHAHPFAIGAVAEILMPRRGDRVLVQRVETVPPARHRPSHGSISSLPPPPVPVRSSSKAAGASASETVSVTIARPRSLAAERAAAHSV